MEFNKNTLRVFTKTEDDNFKWHPHWVAHKYSCGFRSRPGCVVVNIPSCDSQLEPRAHFHIYIAEGLEGFVIDSLLSMLGATDDTQDAVIAAMSTYIDELCPSCSFQAEHSGIVVASAEDIHRYREAHEV